MASTSDIISQGIPRTLFNQLVRDAIRIFHHAGEENDLISQADYMRMMKALPASRVLAKYDDRGESCEVSLARVLRFANSEGWIKRGRQLHYEITELGVKMRAQVKESFDNIMSDIYLERFEEVQGEVRV